MPLACEQNIQQHCKGKYTGAEDYDNFFKAWLGIVHLTTIKEYQSRLVQFKCEYSDTPKHLEAVEYIQSTWLRSDRVESLVQAWTNKYHHFGTTATSR
jgi:hypothetical protein